MMRNLIEKLLKLEQIHTLIRLKATGRPEKLGNKLGVSTRSAERLIQTLRDQGFPIEYDHNRETYYYQSDVKFSFQLFIDGEQKIWIKGGKNPQPPIFGSAFTNICSDTCIGDAENLNIKKSRLNFFNYEKGDFFSV